MRNGQAYQQKMEKFSVSKEKKFGKIDSRFVILRPLDKRVVSQLLGKQIIWSVKKVKSAFDMKTIFRDDGDRVKKERWSEMKRSNKQLKRAYRRPSLQRSF